MSKLLAREKTKKIRVGNVFIGGSKEVILQSMTTCSVSDFRETMKQIRQLELFGCQIVRVAVLNEKDASILHKVVKESSLPIVADIHFVPKLALDAIDANVAKIRLNPGNIQNKELLKEIVIKAREKEIPIRIGMNTGSIQENVLKKHKTMENALFYLCDDYISFFNSHNFDNIILSFKSSDVIQNIKINEIASRKYDYPLHLGVTESGGEKLGVIKSCVGLTPLLLNGIGNTIRVSLTTQPYKEIVVAKQILSALKINTNTYDLVSCPMCGRMQKDISSIVEKVEDFLINNNINLKVSIMGCSVNGIGESSRSDIGIVGGNENVLYYKNGKFIKTIPYEHALESIIQDIKDSSS